MEWIYPHFKLRYDPWSWGTRTHRSNFYCVGIHRALASFGLETAKKRGDGTYKADEEKKKAEAAGGFANGVPYTIIRVETPIKLVPDKPRIDPISGKEVDPQTGKLT